MTMKARLFSKNNFIYDCATRHKKIQAEAE